MDALSEKILELNQNYNDLGEDLVLLEALVEAGNTVVVIEHNLDVIKTADYIIDMGPEGGDRGRNRHCRGNAGGGGGSARLLYRTISEEIFGQR